MAATARDRVKRPRPRALDVAASALVRVLPRRLEPAVDQARLDARTVIDGLRGERAPAYSTSREPLPAPVPLREIDPLAEVLPRGLAARYVSLRRDLAMVGGELRGHRAPSLVPRPTAAYSRYDLADDAAPAAPVTRTLEVVRTVRETADARTIELRALGGPLAARAGQFLTLHVPIDGVEHRRAYSISSVGSDRVCITVKRIAGGRVSSHLVERLEEGARLEAHGPSGSFVLPDATTARHVVLVAGGSGITPIASILRDTLTRDTRTRFTLMYGNRSEADVIFAGELAALASASEGRLSLVHVLSAPTSDAPCVRGVPDVVTLGRLVDERELLARRSGEEPALVMTCGPSPMMAAVRQVFEARGVPADRILEERFLSPSERTRVARAAGPQLVTIRGAGRARELQVSPEQTVLEAALAQGVKLPFSCQMGGCGACRVKGSGELAMDEPNCLSAGELKEGYVLTCVTRALGPSAIEIPSSARGAR
jgi:ring-1,2-phenylacetyl-CoA epoxidase subunit PaaE